MSELTKIAAQVLGLAEKKITPNLQREKTQEWDSFNHLMLISTIEKKLGITFTTKEIESIKTFGDLEALIKKHGKQ